MKWIGFALLAGALLLPPLLAGDFYINLASQILIAAIFALSLNLLVGFGGMTSLGHASYLGVAAYISALLTSQYGFGHGTAAIALDRRHHGDGGRFRRHRAARQRARLPDDHAGVVAGVVGARLSHVQRDQRRQWNCRPDPAGAVRHLAGQRRQRSTGLR